MGSINLSAFVKNKEFDYDDFNKTVKIAVDGLNQVLDEGIALHPLKEQRESVAYWRQIGLGIMGLADMLIKMEIPYDSDKALEICDNIGTHMIDSALSESAMLALYQGVYPGYNEKVLNNSFFNFNASNNTVELVKKYGLHNSQLLTTAPTGSISTMLGISGGIEPIFANSYTRKTESLHGKDVYYKVYTPIVETYIKEHNLKDENELPEWFVTASTINPDKRIDMQSVWQKHIDASISSTVNLPENTTVEEIEHLYKYAWTKWLKGLTIYRENCNRQGILTTEEQNKQIQPSHTLQRGDIIQCSNDLIGKKRKIISGCGGLHILAYFDPDTGDMMEVYLNMGSQGGCLSNTNAISRLLSLLCRAGVDVNTIKDQLDSVVACPAYVSRTATKHDTSRGKSCPSAIGFALIDMWNEMQNDLGLTEEEKKNKPITTVKTQFKVEPAIEQQTDKCPECGSQVNYEGGCVVCRSCGWSKCG